MVKGFFVVHEFAQRLSIHHIFLAAVKVLVTALFGEKRFQSASVYQKPYGESTKMDVCQRQT